MRKRILSMLLTATMALTMLPTVAFAVSDTGNFKVNQATAAGTTEIVYGGQSWYVIGYNGTGVASENGSMTLLAKDVIGSSVQFDSISPYSNEYKDNNLNNIMDGYALVKADGNSGLFTKTEQNAIKKETLIGGSANDAQDGMCGDTVENAILWPLDVAEANKVTQDLRLSGIDWWLRSPGYNDHVAAYVYGYGSVYPNGVNVDLSSNVRPAFKLNLSSVLFASDASGAGAKSGTVDANLSAAQTATGAQKLTIVDSGHTLTAAITTDTLTENSTITVNYTGASTGKTLSAIVVNKATGAVIHYGKLMDNIATTSGTANVTLPADFDSNTMKLKLFTETINGDNLTDYASAPVAVTVEDNTAPTLTAGDVKSNSDKDATVKFTSNEGGQYYYEVVDAGASKPTIGTTGTGTACGTDEQTITLTNLTPGAKDIYIVVKDAAGNVSKDTFKITIPEYVAPTYGITATNILDFGSKTIGYGDAPVEQEVTIKNIGNESVVLTQPVSTNYILTTLSKTTIGSNETATFKVRPKTGLVTGVYDKNLKISTDKNTSATVALKFKVTNKTSSGGGGNSYNYYTITVKQTDGGKISPTTKSIRERLDKTFTIIPDTGYVIKDVLIDGESVGAVKEYTFKKVTKGHTIKAVFEVKKDGNPNPGEGDNPLTNINKNHWFYDSLSFVYTHNLLNGTSPNLFSPSPAAAIEMLITILLD